MPEKPGFLKKLSSKFGSPRPKGEGSGGTGDSDTTSFELVVPDGAKPGDTIRVTAADGNKYVFTLPEGAEPGSQLECELPKAAAAMESSAAAPPTAPPAVSDTDVGVVVPAGAKPGDKIRITATDGKKYVFTVPEGAEPGKPLEVTVPTSVAATLPEDLVVVVPEGAVAGVTQLNISTPEGKILHLRVPEGARPGDTLEFGMPPAA